MSRVRLLYRHFMKAHLSTETTSGELETGLSITHVFALLAIPGVFAAFFSIMKSGSLLAHPTADAVLSAFNDRLLFVLLSMVVTGIATVLNVGKFVSDERERGTLYHLPLSRSIIFAAKLAAFVSFIFLFFIDLHLVSAFVYPASAVPFDAPNGMLLRYVGAHLLTISASSLFSAAFFAAVYGALAACLPPRLFAKVSHGIQLLSVALLTCLLFSGPASLQQLQSARATAKFNPALWFLGLYQASLDMPVVQLVIGKAPVTFEFRGLAVIAVLATATSALVCVPLLAVAWARLSRWGHSGGNPASSPTTHVRQPISAIAGFICKDSFARGIFGFVTLTASRVRDCQLMLAVYLGIAAGLVANQLVSSGSHSLLKFTAPLILLFLFMVGVAVVLRLPVELGASWIFQLAPEQDAARARQGVAIAIWSCGLIPMLLLLAPIYLVLMQPGLAILFLIYCGLLGFLMLKAVTWQIDFIPFTLEETVTKRNLPFIFVGCALLLSVYLYVFGTVSAWAFQRASRAIALDIVLAAICGAMAHAARKAQKLDCLRFRETDTGAVQLLNLGSGA